MGKISAVIVAAGKGRRMNLGFNKQLVEIKGIPLLARTIKKFQESKYIDEIVVVMGADEIEFCEKEIIKKYNFSKVARIVPGGNERQNSVYNGLKAISEETDIVMIHDGARPFIDDNIISSAINLTRKYLATVVAVAIKDTIKSIDQDGFIVDTLDRSKLWAMQTPQTFEINLIKKAHEEAIKNKYLGTDDAVLVERIGQKVKIVEGSYLNIKITTKEDIMIAESIIGLSV